MNAPKFTLIGAAGYVAPKHMEAIKNIGGDLVAAVDKHDAVGVLDRYFPKCEFYHNVIDVPDDNGSEFTVVCTPNYLHTAAARHALVKCENVIVEKPAAISTAQVDELLMLEGSCENKVNCILQMRLHHDAHLMKHHFMEIEKRQYVEIEYHTPRGPWYFKTWKADVKKSGGVLFNIGIHLLDLALNVFGSYQSHENVVLTDDSASGRIELEKATVDFNLSINGRAKRRVFKIGACEYDFTNGFENLHTESYRQILAGKGFGLKDARPAIELCEKLTFSSEQGR